MVIIDPIYITHLRKIFPEISEAKLEVLTLFVYGMARKNIATLKGVSVQAVSKSLRELCDIYGVSNHDGLKTIYAIRLDLHNHLDLCS
ncbi:conjugal transfer protein TraJ [Kosakonia sacchari]|uniref:conjugal transfer protein TraJ n=1 Tax=Kosakonia sacchari TaxID=1158459 RepID=UPI002ACE9827|nr:conjugal transfer protein TraJ [Kosakonia sacchari]MDZ7320167.1 conjugal transfer protein TraJ [Kosakonia sacchari]